MRQTHYSDNQYYYTQKWNKGVCMQSASDYSPFGVLLDGRSMQGDGYRYGFNGKERDDEVKGSGNSYDFGARMYDSRIGRWLTIDPFEKKYMAFTPYNYCGNNPIAFVELDGRDYVYNIYKDSQGNWHLDISSTVHVFSDKGNAVRKVNEYNKFMKDNLNKFKGSYTMNDGTKVYVRINIKFIQGEINVINLRTLNFEQGDNTLYLRQGVIRHKDMGAIGNDYKKGIVGNKIVLDSNGDYYSRAATVVHDVMHQLGLGDRYYDNRKGDVKAHIGFESDLLGLGPQTDYKGEGFSFSNEHFQNYAKKLFKKQTFSGYSIKRVDNHSIDEKP